MAQNKVQMNELQTLSSVVDRLTVLSYEMNIYLVEIEVRGNKKLVYEGGSPKRFNSSQHIRDEFEGVTVGSARMLHESPYDEMIGNPESAQALSYLPFSMNQPY